MNRGMLWAVILCSGVTVVAQDASDLKKEMEDLRGQNRVMQTQLQDQQRLINQLNEKFSTLEKSSQQQQNDYHALRNSVDGEDAPKKPGISIGNVIISGEGGVALFDSQKSGQFTHDDLRVDEARLFLDAPLFDDVYFYGEVDLRTRDAGDDATYLGEMYLDFENLSKYWGGPDGLVNVRAGQFYTPFGEEYQSRFAFDNPLITHSLSDVWAVEGGAEVYGTWKKLCYAAAVQTGDLDVLHDHTSDKTVAGRVGFDPTPHLHLSLSGQRTGDLDAKADKLSGLWFGNLFFMPIGSSKTSTYGVTMGEADARYTWKGGHVAAAGGYAAYDDKDPLGHNHRDIYYYYVEGMQRVWSKLYGAARFSQILTPGGYPVMGDSSEFGVRMNELWRLSLGLGYQFNQHLALKTEYTFEHGMRHDGSSRGHVDMYALEAVFKF